MDQVLGRFGPLTMFDHVVQGVYGGSEDTVYLSPAPLYHSAPLGFNTGFISLGATSIIMEKFDPESALKAIEDYSVTHSQWVPTMFVRFLKVDESINVLMNLYLYCNFEIGKYKKLDDEKLLIKL